MLLDYQMKDQLTGVLNPMNSDASDKTSHCHDVEPYALQVLGVDMEPEFPEHCIIIIEPTNQAIHDAFMVVEVEGDQWFRQFKSEQGRNYLSACNPLYPDIELDATNWQVRGIIRQRNVSNTIKHYSD